MQMVWLVTNVFWPLETSALFTADEVTIGLLSRTTGIALVVGELVFAPFFRYVGFLKWQLVVAGAMTAVFSASMAAVTHRTQPMAIAFTVLIGLAVGWIEMVTIVMVGLVAPPHDIGVAQGFFGATRLVFGVIAGKAFFVTSSPSFQWLPNWPLTAASDIRDDRDDASGFRISPRPTHYLFGFANLSYAVSIFLAIYSNDLTEHLPQDTTTAVEAAGLPASSLPDLFTAISNGTTTALGTVPGVNHTILGALALSTKQAYAHAFKLVYLTTLAFTGIGLIAAFFIEDVDEYLTSYVNKTIRKPMEEKKEVAEP
jgi:hypothetical protein